VCQETSGTVVLMNILIVLPDKKVGGGQIAALRIAKALSRGHRVYVIHAVPECCDEPSPRIPEGVAPIHFLPGAVEAYLPYTLLRCLRFVDRIFTRGQNDQGEGALIDVTRQWYHRLKIKRFARLLHDLQIDVINSHVLAADIFVSECLEAKGVSWVVTMHGCYESCLNDPKHYPDFLTLSERILSRANKIVYLTDKNKAIFTSLRQHELEKKAHKIFTGIDSCSDEKTPQDNSLFRDADLVLGLVSRAIPEKGWREAIAATIGVREETGKNVQLLLLGDGPYADELRAQYELPFIHFIGFSEDVFGWVRKFDVGLLPSWFSGESLPTAVVEYLVCGKPVIATDVGEIANMILANGRLAGLLVPVVQGDGVSDQHLRQAIKSYLLDKNLLAEHSELAKAAAEKFSMQRCLDSYLRVFQAIRE